MNLAIIGFGNIGSKRIEVIKKDLSSKIIYIVDIKKKDNKIINLCNNFGAVYLKCWRKINFDKIDAVILSTPPQLFYPIAKNILKKKKHLLIEKPLGLNLKQSKFLTDLSIKNKVILKTGFNLRFDNSVILAKNLIKKNKVGKIYYIKISYVNGTVLTNKNRIGSLLDIGSHSINLANYFIGDKKFLSMQSFSQSNEYFKDDNGFIFFKHKKILLHIHHSFVSWKNNFHVEISGSKGSVTINSLPKWGTQELIYSKRVYPSGKPKQTKYYFNKDISWSNEWFFFKKTIKRKNFANNFEGLANMRIIDRIKNNRF